MKKLCSIFIGAILTLCSENANGINEQQQTKPPQLQAQVKINGRDATIKIMNPDQILIIFNDSTRRELHLHTREIMDIGYEIGNGNRNTRGGRITTIDVDQNARVIGGFDGNIKTVANVLNTTCNLATTAANAKRDSYTDAAIANMAISFLNLNCLKTSTDADLLDNPKQGPIQPILTR